MIKQWVRELRKIPWRAIVAAIFTVITSNWAASSLAGDVPLIRWFPYLENYSFYIMIGVVVLFIISSISLYIHRQDFFAIKSLAQYPCQPRPCLILLLSPPFRKDVIIKDISGGTSFDIDGVRIPTNLTDDVDRLEGKRWNWHQMLRGIMPHQNKLKQVYLIGSKDEGDIKGSYNAIKYAALLIKYYLPRVEINKCETPIGFEDFDELMQSLNNAINSLRELGYSEKEIIIEVTGGQKTTSIAGAAATLNNQVTFQYVQTNRPYTVLTYDVVVQSPVSL